MPVPPPAIWTAPVQPLMVERRFRLVAPYAAGGHRGIDLGAPRNGLVRAPCGGVVRFRGQVAGGPQTVTIACGGLRATLQHVQSGLGVGSYVAAGSALGQVTGRAIGLSARDATGAYLDPLPLLAQTRSSPPAAGPLPAGRPPFLAREVRSRAARPAHVSRSALVSPRVVAARSVWQPGPDRLLGLIGGVVALLGLLASIARRGVAAGRAARAGSLTAGWPATSQPRSSTSTRRRISATRTR